MHSLFIMNPKCPGCTGAVDEERLESRPLCTGCTVSRILRRGHRADDTLASSQRFLVTSVLEAQHVAKTGQSSQTEQLGA